MVHDQRPDRRGRVASILLRGFTFGIDFEGGTKVSMPRRGEGPVTTQQVEDVFSEALGKDAETVVIVGNGALGHRADPLGDADQRGDRRAAHALFDAFQPKGSDGEASKHAISDSAVSETWGGQITQKALIALVVFLVLVDDLHHGAIRALHGDRRAGHAVLRPDSHRGCVLAGRASRSPRPP